MKVTEVRIFPVVNDDMLRAYATIVLDHSLEIHDIKIIRSKTGFFVSFPSAKRRDGTYKDVAHSLNDETRKMIEGAIMAKYWNFIDPECA